MKKLFIALEQTADSIFITNREGIIEYVNPAFEKMTGFKKEEALGHTPRIIKSGLQSLSYYKKLWSTILSGKTFRTTVVNCRKDGTLFYADHTITPIKDEKGNVTHFVGIWKDITEQVKFEKRKDEFIAVAAHELKNPLTTIKGYLEFLQQKMDKSKSNECVYFITQINEQTDKIINIINDLFDVSKIEAGKFVTNKINFILDELVNKIVINFKHSYASHKFLKTGKAKGLVYGDPQRIGEVLINFLSNAIKYSPEKSIITVRIKQDKKTVTVSVKDFGIGIPKHLKDKVFDRFFKVDQKERVGFGLGLYICSEIIKMHKGKIWVESQEGKGCTFYFSLSLAS